MSERDLPNPEVKTEIATGIPPLMYQLGYRLHEVGRQDKIWVGKFARKEDKNKYPRFHAILQFRFDKDIECASIHLELKRHLTGTNPQSMDKVSEEISRLKTALEEDESPAAQFIKRNLEDESIVMALTPRYPSARNIHHVQQIFIQRFPRNPGASSKI